MIGRFPSLETGTVTCPACHHPINLPVTVTPIPVGADTNRALVTCPPVMHRCDDEDGAA